ncbi:reverse transcriptase domain-containing protein [Tanacetum coccineum]
MYLSASHGAINVVLMTERNTVQTPVYFVSRALQGPKLNYTLIEKLILALVCAAKRLRRYFQAHPIVVITDQPIKQVMSRPNVAGRLQKWSVVLGEHNITYRPRTSVKGQILVDFLVEKPDEVPPGKSATEILQEPWTLFTDESCVDGSGTSLILTSPERIRGAQRPGECGLQIGGKLSTGDVCRQRGKYGQVPGKSQSPVLQEKSIQEKDIATIVEEEGLMWMTTIIEYLRDGILPEDNKEASKLCIEARQYELLDRVLYKRSFLAPWLRTRKDQVLIVAMDYFTKWIEAKAVAAISKKCKRATIQEAKAKSKMTKYYNVKVRGVAFKPGDFVYRSNDASHAMAGRKLRPKWEGTYEVTEALEDKAYRLRSMEGTVLPQT